ncbi:hypothetical protein IWQ61_003604 [Dispira simplex]|nr:hypothetical protein IWQ61_003604 [Dispira simplex]
MYLYIVNYIFLISLVLEELGCDANDIAIKHRILPHPENDVWCDSDANIRYDIVLCCCGSDADVKQEYKPFESKLNPSNGAPRRRKKRKVDKQNHAEEDNDDKFRKRIKEAFGIIEVKSSPKEDGNLKTYAQLGWYVRCALDAQFDRNSMWGITVSGTLVRFVLFTHSAVIPSSCIDMKTTDGRKQFVNDYIRFSLCPGYRVGYDPTKTWLPNPQRWKVECFDSNRNKNQQGGRSPCAHVYVDPKPITSGGSLFGRRTRCYHASLTEEAELNFILKESWTEVDGKINNVKEPNEVRIFNHIASVDRESNKKPLTENGVPKMKYGGTVCIRKEHVHGAVHQMSEWYYDTMSLYCGGLKVESDSGSNHNPSTSQGKFVNTGNVEEPRKCVECIHQWLVLTPVGKPMTRLHPYGTQPESEVPIILPPAKEKELYTNVGYFFKVLFIIIRRLHKDYKIYHCDLSEGNVLVVEIESPHPTKPNVTVIVLEPLLIDFDHARLKDDNIDQMDNFNIILKELCPEFKRLRTLFQGLRDALFKWEGGSGALVTTVEKTTVEARADDMDSLEGVSNWKLEATDDDDEARRQLRAKYHEIKERIIFKRYIEETHDPLEDRAKHEDAVAENFYTAVIFK